MSNLRSIVALAGLAYAVNPTQGKVETGEPYK